MRTNIVIDDTLMDDALKLTGLKTKREAVELGLRTLIRLKQQEEIRRFRGKLHWDGDPRADADRLMVLVDSSVWIAYFNGAITPETQRLDTLLGQEPVGSGEI